MKIKSKIKPKKITGKKSKRASKSKKVALPDVILAAQKRKCVDVAVPFDKLWFCKLGKFKIAFVKNNSTFPLGLVVKMKKRKTDYLLHIRPFDSSEHEKLAMHLCFA